MMQSLKCPLYTGHLEKASERKPEPTRKNKNTTNVFKYKDIIHFSIHLNFSCVENGLHNNKLDTGFSCSVRIFLNYIKGYAYDLEQEWAIMLDLSAIKKTQFSIIFTWLPFNTSFLTANVYLLLKNYFKTSIFYEVCI